MTGATITTNKIIQFTVWFFILGQKSSIKGGPRPVQRQSVFGIRGRKTSFKCLPLSDRDDRHFIVVDYYIWIFQWKWIGAQLTTSQIITFCVGTSMRKPITQYLLIFDVQRKCPGFLNSPSTSRKEIKSCPGESPNYVCLFVCLDAYIQLFWCCELEPYHLILPFQIFQIFQWAWLHRQCVGILIYFARWR